MAAVEQVITNKSWHLSLYEIHRKPQELIMDDGQISVNPRSLQNEVICPICLEILHNTMTTKECLHRFCSECITTALRNGNKVWNCCLHGMDGWIDNL